MKIAFIGTSFNSSPIVITSSAFHPWISIKASIPVPLLVSLFNILIHLWLKYECVSGYFLFKLLINSNALSLSFGTPNIPLEGASTSFENWYASLLNQSSTQSLSFNSSIIFFTILGSIVSLYTILSSLSKIIVPSLQIKLQYGILTFSISFLSKYSGLPVAITNLFPLFTNSFITSIFSKYLSVKKVLSK